MSKKPPSSKLPNLIYKESTDSPELPNLIELNSLADRKKTHVLKKKPKTSENLKVHEQSVTNGIVALDVVSAAATNNSVKSKKEDLEDISQRTSVTKPTDMSKKPPSNKLPNLINKESTDQFVAPDVNVNKNKRKVTPNLENQMNDIFDLVIGSSENNSAVGKTPIELNKELAQENNVPERNDKDNVAEMTTHKNKNKRNIKPKKENTNSNLDLNVEPMKITRPKRALRERNPHMNYEDKSEVITYDLKENGRKKKKELLIKSSQEYEENSREPLGESKNKRKTKVTVSNKQNIESSIVNEIQIRNEKEESGQNNAIETVKSIETQNKKTTGKGTRKNTDGKRKYKSKNERDLEVSGGKKLEPIEKLQNESDSQQNIITNKEVAAKSTNKSKKIKSQSKKETTNECVDNKDAVAAKHSFKNNARENHKNSIVSERTVNDRSCQLVQDKKDLETESCVHSTGTKRKLEDVDCNESHSGAESSSTRQKRDEGKVTKTDIRYNLNDLLGTSKTTTQEIQPGVTAVRSIHIYNFLMMGQVSLDPGAALTKISTNTAYAVVEGSAQVTIKKVTKYFKAIDESRRFFIPRNIDVSIVNCGDGPLKMEFVKFRGEP